MGKPSSTARGQRLWFRYALIIALLLIIGVPSVFAQANVITGIAFRDFNANGVRDTDEPGVGGISVTAYNSTGTSVATATSFATLCLGAGSPVAACTGVGAPEIGSYRLAWDGETAVRVEFSLASIPTGSQPGVFGSGSGTSVQFVSAGGTANFGINRPGDFCNSAAGDARLATTCVVNGDPTQAGSSTLSTLVTVPYLNSSPPGGGTPPGELSQGQHNQTGSIWGVAYQRSTETLFAAANLKRHIGLSTAGLGAIFRSDVNTPNNATLLVDLDVAFPTLDLGQALVPSNVARGLPVAATDPSYDEVVFGLIGEVGIGDLDIGEDDQTLFFSNLFDRNIYSFRVTDTGTPSVVPASLVNLGQPTVACTGGVARPWGLGVRDGFVYAGWVCTSESGGTQINLTANLFRRPSDGTGAWAAVYSFALNYPKGDVGFAVYPAGHPRAGDDVDVWETWSDDFGDFYNYAIGGGATQAVERPQPILSDIEFDADGSLVVGFADRAGHQLGHRNLPPNTAIANDPANLLTGIAGGDILRVCNVNGTYQLESGGTCPGRTASANNANNQGPDNGEFYFGENLDPPHQETSYGGLAIFPGQDEVIMTAMDPLRTDSGGFIALSNDTGGKLRSIELYFGAGTNEPTSGKANGIGDIALMCEAAPIEIGNRVWFDTNANGVQDPGEAPIAGVEVQLRVSAGTPAAPAGLIASATTDANGNYYFSSGVGVTTTSAIYNIAGLTPNTSYFVVIPAGQTPLAGATITEANDSVPSPGGSDVNDSDGTAVGVYVSGVQLTTGGPGANNHTYDFGFVQRFSLGNRIWEDVNRDGIDNAAGEPGIAGVTVRILDSSGSATVDVDPVTSGIQNTFVTNTQGYYRFDNLLAGSYIVEIVESNFQGAAPLVGFLSTTTGTTTENTDLDDNGIDNATPATNGIRSAVVTVNASENTGDPSNSPVETLDQTGAAPDARYDATVDFGFIPPTYSLGNRVWLDTDNSGTLNGSEAGINGVTVRLLDSGGNPVDVDLATPGTQNTVVTANGGYYRFDGLPAGDYIVEVVTPAGLVSSTDIATSANPNNDVDSDDNGITVAATTVRSAVVALGPGNSEPTNDTDEPGGGYGTGSTLGTPVAPGNRSNLSVDFGFTPTYSLGNRVWLDSDDSGTINGTETGINGVTVRILSSAGAATIDLDPVTAGTQNTVVTANGGYYRFDGLPSGNYIVEVVTPSGFVSSTDIATSANPNNDVDSDDNGVTVAATTVRSAVVALGPGTSEPTNDTDEPGGGYGTGSTLGGTAAPNDQSNLTVDFGFVRQVYSLGNRVWLDTDNSATLNGAEAGIDGVTVRILNGTGGATIDIDPVTSGIQNTLVTANGGYYRFDELPAGNYIVEVVGANFSGAGPLVGLISSTDIGTSALPNNDVDSDDNGVTPSGAAIRSGVVTLGPANSEPTTDADEPAGGYGAGSTSGTAAANNRSNLTVDFGFVAPTLYSLGNRVWLDPDNSGTLNGAEAGIDGVTVRILSSTGAATVDLDPVTAGTQNTVVTANGGYYRFDGLPVGSYIVEVVATNFSGAGPLVGLISSTDIASSSDPNNDGDSDDNGVNLVSGSVRSNVVIVGPGASEPTNDTDEPGGGYGTGSTLGGAAAPNDRSNLSVDFGFTATFSLGNRVWEDTDNSGTINGTETGIDGVTIRLLDSGGNPVDVDRSTPGVQNTVVTADGGYYRFDGLPAGNYVVEVVTPSGFISSTDIATSATPNNDVDSDDNGITLAATTVRSAVVTLGPGTSEPTTDTDEPGGGYGPGSTLGGTAAPNDQSNLTVDFGFVRQSTLFSLGNRVWFDTGAGANTNNGLINTDEIGIAGVVVNLYRETTGDDLPDGGVIATVTTDSSGYYRFDGLADGRYIVEVVPPAGVTSSTDIGSSTTPDNDTDSDDNGVNVVGAAVRSNTITLGPTANEPANETDNPASYGAGSTTGTAAPNAQSNLTLDFGFVLNTPMSLGNRVWIDTDNSGTLNGTEAGVDGVTVQLYRDTNGDTIPDGAPIATTATAGGGYYLFANLVPGQYIVGIPAVNFQGTAPLVGFLSSTGPGQQSNPNGDIDSDDNGLDSPTPDISGIFSNTITLTLNSEVTGEDATGSGTGGASDANSNLTLDFGFFQPPANTLSLGNRVWIDTDNSGTINGSEAGIGGVVVNLVQNGTVIATTTTTSSGYYLFAGLAPGDYVVTIPASNFAPGAPLFGSLSSTGPGQEATPNDDGDNNDNGIDDANPAANGISSGLITLALGAEPTDETDLGSGTGGATDENSNLTLDFGFSTPVAVTPTPEPQPTGQPGPRVQDPGIVKLGEPAFAQPGEGVTFIITVTNPNAIPLDSVIFTDTVPNQFTVLGATASAGTVTVTGQTVRYFFQTMPPLSSIEVRIRTRLRDDVVPPITIDNMASLSGIYSGSSTATISVGIGDISLRVTELPGTGEPPWWRMPALLVVVLLLLAAGYRGVRHIERNIIG